MDVEYEIDRITNFIREIIKKSKTNGVVIGLSGGIDSATSAALCVNALGKNRVFALILPCHSNEADLTDATFIAQYLGIQYKIVDLTETYDTLLHAISHNGESKSLARANMKPRLRMSVLYFYATQRNALVAGTGNKSEDDIGYFTKYGDGGVDFLPIQHLYKHEVREVARYLRLPERIVTRKPTAGLWEDQTDEDELSSQLDFPITYEQLDEMLENIENKNFNIEDPHYQKVLQLMELNRHKLEVPPALKRTS